jgi:(S)-ureidoglycine aminohydrolase
MGKYYYPQGGLPPQTHLTTERAIVTEAYTVIPKGVMTDIVTSNLPGFLQHPLLDPRPPDRRLRHHVLTADRGDRPGGGAPKAEFEAGVEGVIFVTKGKVNLTLDGELHQLEEGGYAYLAAGATWGLENVSNDIVSFQWIRKAYERLEGFEAKSFVTSDAGRGTHRDAGYRRRLEDHPLYGLQRPGP